MGKKKKNKTNANACAAVSLPESSDEILTALLEDGDEICGKANGYVKPFCYESNCEDLVYVQVRKLNGDYYVMVEDGWTSEIVLETNDKDEAVEYFNNLQPEYESIEKQIEKTKEALSNINGLYFDAKYNSWNVKYNYNMLIEKTQELSVPEIRAAVKLYNDTCIALKEQGITLNSLYKKPRERNNNQRYYVFEFEIDGELVSKEVHIPSKMQHKERCPIRDFFRMDWVSELKATAEWQKQERAEIFAKRKITPPPFEYEKALELKNWLVNKNILFICEGNLRHTEKWLRKNCNSLQEVENALEFVQLHGGYCDCEVVMNAISEEEWRLPEEGPVDKED